MNSSVNLILAVAGTQSVVNALGQVSGALGGVAGASALSAAALTGVKSALDLAGKFADMSARTGQSVRDLVVLERAYKNAGLSSEALAQSVGLLQRALNGRNEEGGKTGEVFKKLGLSVETLKRQDFASQLQSISTAISRLPSPVERTAAAMGLFGRSGAQMLQVLGDGNALRQAESEAGRLADKLQRNAERFDAIGDRLSIVKTRMDEMWLTAAERLIPALERASSLLNGMNLSVVGAVLPEAMSIGGTIAAAVMAKKVVEKLNDGVMDWATRQGAPVGQAFAGRFLAPITGSLSGLAARVLPIGLAAAIAKDVALGLYAGWREFQDSKVDASSSALDRANRIGTAAGEVRTENDRRQVLAQAIAAFRDTKKLLKDEESSWWTNDQAVSGYESAITRLTRVIKLLDNTWSDGWAQQRMKANSAADDAARKAAAIAAAEASAREWFFGDKKTAAEERRATLDFASMQPGSQLLVAETNLALHDKATKAAIEKAKAEGSYYLVQKLTLEGDIKRSEILQQIVDSKEKVLALASREAKAALEDERMNIDAKLAALDASLAKTDAEKWSERRVLMAESLKAAEAYLAKMREIRNAATTPGDIAAADANVRGAVQDVGAIRMTTAAMGPDPASYSDQILSATVAAQNQIGTLQQQVGRLWGQTGESIRSTMGGTLGDIALMTGSTRDKLMAASSAIYSAFVRNGAQMVVDWGYNHLIMGNVSRIAEAQRTAGAAAGASTRSAISAGETAAAISNTAVQVGAHGAGEGAKTATSGVGALGRKALMLGETVWHGIQVGIRTGAHLLGETLKTGVTIAQTALRIPVILMETGASLIQAGIKGMSAMASIPYVGPILAIAALAAIIGAGSAIMKKGFSAGG